jgi:hypothetical protein
VIYLVIGLDKDTLTPWHAHIGARDVPSAETLARTRACRAGIDLIVAAVVGQNSTVLGAET